MNESLFKTILFDYGLVISPELPAKFSNYHKLFNVPLIKPITAKYMKKTLQSFFFHFTLVCMLCSHHACDRSDRAPLDQLTDRLEWWRQARFGLFIHWGLYSIPAGEWDGALGYGEWIRHSAHIPLEVYDQFTGHFNPAGFNADDWVRKAKEAGMKYIVITSKHHDGFCLFNSEFTDFDVMATPFQRDPLKELTDACRREDIRLCFYYSIMDWHHPDYIPRREWEIDRPSDSASFDRYVKYMKNQLKELTGNYGPLGILWFDGEWESTWDHTYGKAMYDYVRELQPSIIINNRVDVGRSGMAGLTREGEYAGDYGTPEQEVPATGLPGVDWETCLTMNDHWGYNKNDHNWKSSAALIRMLADIASKGGNFLLNVGPTAHGTFPQESIERLKDIGDWMEINSTSIYGTKASPFRSLPWGKCTTREIRGGTMLYLHVFDWPSDGHLIVSGLYNDVKKAYLLSDPGKKRLYTHRDGDSWQIHVPATCPDPVNTVVALEIRGRPDVNDPPEIMAKTDIFTDTLVIRLKSHREQVGIRYTTDGSEPSLSSPLADTGLIISRTTTLSARCFRNDEAVSGVSSRTFRKVDPIASVPLEDPQPGVNCTYYEGNWDHIPALNTLKPAYIGFRSNFTDQEGNGNEYYALLFKGNIHIPKTGVYTLYIASDDGSQLLIHDQLLIDNDGLHSLIEKSGHIPLEKGFHPIEVRFFEKTGGDELLVSIEGVGMDKQPVPDSLLFHSRRH